MKRQPENHVSNMIDSGGKKYTLPYFGVTDRIWASRSGLPLPSPEDLPDPETEPTSPASPALAGGFFTTEPPGKPFLYL